MVGLKMQADASLQSWRSFLFLNNFSLYSFLFREIFRVGELAGEVERTSARTAAVLRYGVMPPIQVSIGSDGPVTNSYGQFQQRKRRS